MHPQTYGFSPLLSREKVRPGREIVMVPLIDSDDIHVISNLRVLQHAGIRKILVLIDSAPLPITRPSEPTSSSPPYGLTIEQAQGLVEALQDAICNLKDLDS